MSKLTNILLVIAILALTGWVLITPKKSDQSALQTQLTESPSPMPSPKLQFSQAEQVISAKKQYLATLHTTAGDITIQLSKDTPVTTNNFVFLSQKGYYDNVIFHRVIPGFMIQGGDPTGTGSGGPGYQFDDEKFDGEYTRGTVAMANAGPNTNGSQFFIMHADYPLPTSYVIFGHVTSGMDTVDKIATSETIQDGRENSRPKNPVSIQSVEITEK